MAEADFNVLTNSLSTASIDRGATAGTTPPNGGGSFSYGMAAVDATEGIVGLYTNITNFNPMLLGGSIRGALRRSGTNTDGFAPFLFIGANGSLTTANGYMLGLSDDDVSHIQLRKGTLSTGLPAAGVVTKPPTNGLLAQSDDPVAFDAWAHLRLDQIVNPNGDVILRCYKNDLVANPVSSPVWVPIPGLDMFVDDTLAINSGSAALLGGRAGFAMYKKAAGRVAFFDYLEILRQT